MSKKKKTQKNNPMKPSNAAPETPKAEDVTNSPAETEKDVTNTAADIDSNKADAKEVESQKDENSKDKDPEQAPEVETPAEEDRIDFASEPAGEFFAENKDKIVIDDVKGTGKDGSITKGDLEEYLKAQEPAEKTKAPTPEKKPDAEKKDTAAKIKEVAEEDADVNLVVLAILDELASFESPVRGALNTKPNVKERWNKLMKRANKLQKRLTK